MFIFQSFISTNVRQCFCPPSIDPQRAKEMGKERQGVRRGGGGGEGGVGDKKQSRKTDTEREKWEIKP